MKTTWFAPLCLLVSCAASGLPVVVAEPTAAPERGRQPDASRRPTRQRLAEAIAQTAQARLVRLRESGLGQAAAVDALEALRDTSGGAVELFYALTDATEPAGSREPAIGVPRPSAGTIVAALLREPRDLRRRLKLAELHEVVDRLEAQEQPSSPRMARLRMLLGEIALPETVSNDCLAGLAPRCQPWLDPLAPGRLREAVEQARQLIAFDRQAARDRGNELLARQTRLVATIDADELSEMAVGPLVDEQTAIGHELARLAGLLGRTTGMRRELTAARAAADAAAERLFELDRQAAHAAAQSVADSLRRLCELMRLASESQAAGRPDSAAWPAWRDRLARLAAQFERSRQASADQPTLREALAELERQADEQRLPPWADAELVRSTIELRTLLASNEEPIATALAAPESKIHLAIERVASAIEVEIQVIAARNSPANRAAAVPALRSEPRLFTPDADFSNAPWLHKLPPENQRAIVSGRHAPPPRGFAQRLERLNRRHAESR